MSTPAELVSEFMAVLDAAREAASRSVLDGTISCEVCRCLVLESNAHGHYRWHYQGQRVDQAAARRGMAMFND